MTNIIPLLSKPESLLKTIREILKNSSNVHFGPALEKGIAGDLSMSQIWKCLETGTLTSTPVQNEHGHYLCELNTVAAGQDVYLTIAVDTSDVTNRSIFVLHISEG